MIIDNDFRLDDLTLIKHLKSVESPFLSKIREVYDETKDILNTRVQHVFPNYTLHNTGHSFRIMEYMSKLIQDYKKLNELEVTLLIYSALLHDIGMAVGDEDIIAIKSDDFAFCDIKFSAMKKLMNGDEDLALQEYVRRIHSSLSAKYINEKLKDKFTIPKLANLDFTKELSLICESHTKDYDWIKQNLRINEIRGDYHFNSQYLACILRMADILDIDGNRTPYNLYKIIAPKNLSDEEWKQHFVISNNDKIIYNEKTNQKKLVFHGKANNASIHRKILTYISWVESELVNSTILVQGMPNQYNLVFETKPEVNIQTEGYSFSDYKMTLEFKAISSLLMGEKIYGNKNLGVRELIQNSIDACRIREENELDKQEFGEDSFQPKIKVILDKAKNQVIIKDNGAGMSMSIIKKHFLNIGVSYYNSTDFLLRDLNYKPIGNFGIGFLSCFMLSNEVTVITRHYQSKNKYVVELEKGNEWTSLTESEDVQFYGTEVILNYENFLDVFDNDLDKIKTFLNRYFLTDGINFELINKIDKQIISISNPINPIDITNKGLIKINLIDYIKDIDGYVLIRNRTDFVKKFDELNFLNVLYKYDDENGLIEIEDFSDLKIDDYIIDTEIKYVDIPIVESHLEDDFQSGMKFTDNDLDEVISKLDRELMWITVVIPKELQKYVDNQIIDSNNPLFDKLGIEELREIGQSDYCDTKCTVNSINLYQGIKNQLYLPFDKKDLDFGFMFYRSSKRKELFMRSVLIKDFKFHIPISASIFEIDTIVANINSRNFIPDISRNNIDDNSKNIINYIIGKAIHIGASKSLKLDSKEVKTLNNFISKFYSEKTEYEK